MLNNEDYMKIFHEIKNSITLISSYLQLIEKKHPQIAAFDYWETTQSETARLRTIVTELSQVKLGSSLQLEPLHLDTFLTEYCENFHGFDGKEEVSCELSISKTPCIATADPKQLRHAINNLLKNSCEAMQHHGTIHISLQEKHDSAVIRITDFGSGISPELIEHIFDPFLTTKDDGSGLGLSITRQIITAHNGTIFAESKKDSGTTFTILLPLAAAS